MIVIMSCAKMQSYLWIYFEVAGDIL